MVSYQCANMRAYCAGSHFLFCVRIFCPAPRSKMRTRLFDEGVECAMQQDELILTVSSKKQKEEELTYLRTVERPNITEAIRKAREYGDLSENFEYQSARQAQAILNGRIAELEALLERARVVEDAAAGVETVQIGCVVTVNYVEDDEEVEYAIVDSASADPLNDRISYASPIGQALMHRRVEDTVEATLPSGKVKIKVLSIRPQ
jgi:transcription elongation factor GreA